MNQESILTYVAYASNSARSLEVDGVKDGFEGGSRQSVPQRATAQQLSLTHLGRDVDESERSRAYFAPFAAYTPILRRSSNLHPPETSSTARMTT